MIAVFGSRLGDDLRDLAVVEWFPVDGIGSRLLR